MRRTRQVTNESGSAENAGDDVLHFARMLGGRIDQHRAVLARHGERDLAFQIKMLLPADVERAGKLRNGAAGDRLGGIAVDEGVIGQHALAGRFALLDGTFGRSASISKCARSAARRAASREVATTANMGWPWKMTRSCANTGSSANAGEMSFLPGMSAAVTTATTPGALLHLGKIEAADASRARPANRRRRHAGCPPAREYRRCIRRAPCTCLAALSCGSALWTWRAASPMRRYSAASAIIRRPAMRVVSAFRTGNLGQRLDDQIAATRRR